MHYLAVDIGASSGRHILGSYENGKLTLKEIYRFSNGPTKKGDSLIWDVDELFKNIKEIDAGHDRCSSRQFGLFAR